MRAAARAALRTYCLSIAATMIPPGSTMRICTVCRTPSPTMTPTALNSRLLEREGTWLAEADR
jgi:hypothetical protein